ncbi:MAG: M50 family metallopeptidase [Clostridium sp.]|nr:M50 family metallopeptidase [Clostridium sp.]
MKVKHLLIDYEEKRSSGLETYLVSNTKNGIRVRLGKNEVSYLLNVLEENEGRTELNIQDCDDIDEELKNKMLLKFEEWGFFDDSIGKKNYVKFDKLKKIHLVSFNVESMLKSIYPIYSKLFSKTGFIVWLISLFMILGYYTYNMFTFNASEVVNAPVFQFTTLNIVLIVIAIFINTIFHEFAHAVTCTKYGGEVKEMGILLFYLIPCIYCDVSGVYNIRDRKKRAIVGLAGIYSNLFISTILFIIASILAKFNVVSVLLFYIAIVNIVTSLYNLIPFVKLDGYWVLSALSGIDNLMDKSVVLAYTTLFSRKNLKKIHMNSSKRIAFSIYGVISLFFSEVFWIYTSYNISNMFDFNIMVEKSIFVVIVVIVLFDFIKTIQHYYKLIKNDYNRILMVM